MKKIFTLSLFIVFVASSTAQILSRSENWPNANWVVSGTYTPAALVLNPTTNDKFKYDASLAVPLGGAATIYITSPFFDLKPAFDGGEKIFKSSLILSFQTSASNVLFYQYWNADTSTWVSPPDANAPAAIEGDFNTCLNNNVGDFILDYTSFTTNQLQNFRYRFGIIDAGGQISGVCLNSPVLTSFIVLPPSGLNATNITTTSATLDWVGNNGFGNNTSYELEYGVQGFVLGTGVRFPYFPPALIFGLNSGTNYAFYVRENLNDQGSIYSTWAGPRSFMTTTLGLEEHKLKGFKLYPNPIKNTLWMESEKALNEIKIFNMAGQELMNIKLNKLNSSLDLTSLSAGFYFLRVTTDSDSGTYKILKE